MDEAREIKNSSISVVIPTLNEEQNIPILLARLNSALSQSFLKYELIFVDDNSTDNTAGLLKAAAKRYPLKVFLKQGRPGKAFSLLEGFAHAQYELAAILDADLQYPPEALPEMAGQILAGHGVVIGRRAQRKVSLPRKIASKSFSFSFAACCTALRQTCKAA